MEHRAEMWRTLRRVITAAAVLVGLWLVISTVKNTLASTGARVERGLKEVLGAITNRDTRIVEGRAEITGTAEISELALLDMRMSATRTIEKSEELSGLIPLGTKRLIVRGHYQVKGGYRLLPGISLRMEHGRPVASFPKPEILSVELIDFDVLSEDSGWLNKVQPEDRAQILRELRSQMRKEAELSGMLSTVEATLRTRLRDLLGADSVTVEQVLP